MSSPIVAVDEVPAKTGLSGRPKAWFFVATSFSFSQKSAQDCTQVGLYDVEFFGADRHHIGQVIDDARGKFWALVRGKGDQACVSTSSLPTMLGDATGRVMTFAEVRVTTYPIH